MSSLVPTAGLAVALASTVGSGVAQIHPSEAHDVLPHHVLVAASEFLTAEGSGPLGLLREPAMPGAVEQAVPEVVERAGRAMELPVGALDRFVECNAKDRCQWRGSPQGGTVVEYSNLRIDEADGTASVRLTTVAVPGDWDDDAEMMTYLVELERRAGGWIVVERRPLSYS